MLRGCGHERNAELSVRLLRHLGAMGSGRSRLPSWGLLACVGLAHCGPCASVATPSVHRPEKTTEADAKGESVAAHAAWLLGSDTCVGIRMPVHVFRADVPGGCGKPPANLAAIDCAGLPSACASGPAFVLWERRGACCVLRQRLPSEGGAVMDAIAYQLARRVSRHRGGRVLALDYRLAAISGAESSDVSGSEPEDMAFEIASLGPDVVTRVELWFGETLQVWRSAQGPGGAARAADLLWQRWWEKYAPSALDTLRRPSARRRKHSSPPAPAFLAQELVHEVRVLLYKPHGMLTQEALVAPELWFGPQDALLLRFGRAWQLFEKPAQGSLLESVRAWLGQRGASLERGLEAPGALVRTQRIGVGRWNVVMSATSNTGARMRGETRER